MKKNDASRTPGRPRNFDMDQALQAAMLLFWRYGYEGTSLAQLTEAMGIKPPSLYAAFGSKEQLYQAVLARYGQQEGDGMAGILAEPGPIRPLLERLLCEAARLFTQPERPGGCLIASGALRCGDVQGLAFEATASLRRASRDAIRARLDVALASGDLAAGTDTRTLATFIAALIQGLSVQALDGAGREQLIQTARLALAAIPLAG